MTERSKIVTWHDPKLGAELAKTMSGLDYMQAMVDGEVAHPPIRELMQMDVIAVEVGKATLTCEVDESMYNPIGTVHGGLMCTLLDTVLGCAVHTTLPLGQGYTSLEIKVSYLRPVTLDSGTLTAVGTVTKPGIRAAFADGTIHDAQGRLVATGSSTCLIFPV